MGGGAQGCIYTPPKQRGAARHFMQCIGSRKVWPGAHYYEFSLVEGDNTCIPIDKYEIICYNRYIYISIDINIYIYREIYSDIEIEV